jgi:UDP-N-acetylmuramyl pentapeptide phosphotransferase/UDP-N-acetylglucosamine-1-phosphate transferase
MTDIFKVIINLYPSFLALFATYFILSFFWKNIFPFFNLKQYNQAQRVHQDEIPRLGGVVIYIILFVLVIIGTLQSNFIFAVLISSLPLILISLKEDLFHNTKPITRLFVMLLCCLLFFYMYPVKFPSVDFPYLGSLINYYPIAILFFAFSAVVVINGMNLIDGMNGLLAMTLLSQVFSLYLFMALQGNQDIQLELIILGVMLIIFLTFNFPLGKIFFGDAGAYFFGYLISMYVVVYFGKNTEVLSWKAVLLFFYPALELLFSFVRKKIFEKKSPFSADAKHLHSLIFNYIQLKNPSKFNNSVVTLILLPFAIMPPIASFYINNIIYVLLALFMLTTVYIFLYLYFNNLLIQEK